MKPWRELLAESLRTDPQRSNVNGVLISYPHGGVRLAKQTPYGDEYVTFAHTNCQAWNNLARITGRSVDELKRLPLTRIEL